MRTRLNTKAELLPTPMQTIIITSITTTVIIFIVFFFFLLDLLYFFERMLQEEFFDLCSIYVLIPKRSKMVVIHF